MQPVMQKLVNKTERTSLNLDEYADYGRINESANITQEFAYSLKLNETPRTKYGGKEYLIPLQEFQKVWENI